MTGSFNKLTLSQKYILLCDKGKLVGTIRVENRKITLYVMGNKYYQLYYDEAGNFIENIQQLNTLNFFRTYWRPN
jgi:hypothetical protein